MRDLCPSGTHTGAQSVPQAAPAPIAPTKKRRIGLRRRWGASTLKHLLKRWLKWARPGRPSSWTAAASQENHRPAERSTFAPRQGQDFIAPTTRVDAQCEDVIGFGTVAALDVTAVFENPSRGGSLRVASKKTASREQPAANRQAETSESVPSFASPVADSALLSTMQ